MIEIDEIISNAEYCANEYKKFSEIAPERSLTFKKYEEDHRQLAEWLKELKQLREQTRWIPVSERLPEDHENVLIWLKSNHITIGLYNSHKLPCDDRPIGWGVDAEISVHNFCSDDVLAWMPLPEPYEPQEWREIENDT